MAGPRITMAIRRFICGRWQHICACVEWVDDAVGRILHTLAYLGLADDTLVIYSSDHGEMAGEKGAWQKTLFFDQSAKVPLIIKWPANTEAMSRLTT